MFADDPHMQVTQEPEGTIRMVETDVPRDLLDLKIRHISFRGGNGGANAALIRILSTPEVDAFMKANKIGPRADELPASGDSRAGRRAYGELDNVTVSQALDYVVKIFPGAWLYENCESKEGDRTVYFGFVSTPPAWGKQP
jgi:hypothetical protein